MPSKKTIVQIAWGVVLVFTGIGVLFRIPQVIEQVKDIEQFSSVILFIHFCFYLLSILLIGGGAKKVFDNYQKLLEGKRQRRIKDA
jgi:hypothetical protein